MPCETGGAIHLVDCWPRMQDIVAPVPSIARNRHDGVGLSSRNFEGGDNRIRSSSSLLAQY